MAKIKLYSGDGLTNVKDDAKPLIQSVLWERDIVMLLGSEKAGKSILAQQMAFALTSGEGFLDKYAVPNPTGIIYVQTEGKDAEMARRIECMERAVPINRELYARAYKKFLPLDVAEFKQELMDLIKGLNPIPKVMFIDSLYTSMVGDLVDNKDVRHLLAELSSINDEFNMASVVIHHEVKDGFDREGNKVEQGDKRSYGSVFLRAFVEHILYLSSVGDPRKDMRRVLRCDTTRTGQVMDTEKLKLVQPDPLYFDLEEDMAFEIMTFGMAKKRGITDLKEISEEYAIPEYRLKKAMRMTGGK